MSYHEEEKRKSHSREKRILRKRVKRKSSADDIDLHFRIAVNKSMKDAPSAAAFGYNNSKYRSPRAHNHQFRNIQSNTDSNYRKNYYYANDNQIYDGGFGDAMEQVSSAGGGGGGGGGGYGGMQGSGGRQAPTTTRFVRKRPKPPGLRCFVCVWVCMGLHFVCCFGFVGIRLFFANRFEKQAEDNVK